MKSCPFAYGLGLKVAVENALADDSFLGYLEPELPDSPRRDGAVKKQQGEENGSKNKKRPLKPITLVDNSNQNEENTSQSKDDDAIKIQRTNVNQTSPRSPTSGIRTDPDSTEQVNPFHLPAYQNAAVAVPDSSETVRPLFFHPYSYSKSNNEPENALDLGILEEFDLDRLSLSSSTEVFNLAKCGLECKQPISNTDGNDNGTCCVTRKSAVMKILLVLLEHSRGFPVQEFEEKARQIERELYSLWRNKYAADLNLSSGSGCVNNTRTYVEIINTCCKELSIDNIGEFVLQGDFSVKGLLDIVTNQSPENWEEVAKSCSSSLGSDLTSISCF